MKLVFCFHSAYHGTNERRSDFLLRFVFAFVPAERSTLRMVYCCYGSFQCAFIIKSFTKCFRTAFANWNA